MFNKTVLPSRGEMQIYRHLAKRKIKKRYGRRENKKGDPPAARSPGGRHPE